jgi:hypothetical protein
VNGRGKWEIKSIQLVYPAHCEKCDPEFKAPPIYRVSINTHNGGYNAEGKTVKAAIKAARRLAKTWMPPTTQSKGLDLASFDAALSRFIRDLESAVAP